MSQTNLLQISKTVEEEVLKKLDATEVDVVENVEALRAWMKQVPHLPVDHISDERLKIFLLRHGLSVEKTKRALEGYYTAKTLIADYFDNLIPFSMAYQNAKTYTCVVSIPEMLNSSRITIHKLSNIDGDVYDPVESFTIMSMINEIRLNKDYSFSDTIIVDLFGYSLKHLVKFTPKVIKKLRYLMTKSFNYQVESIHVINVPHYTDKVLTIFRSVMPGKIYKKVFVHTTMDHLYLYVPQKYLPSDYGGTQPSLIDLCRKWCDEIEVSGCFFEEQLSVKTMEDRRVGRCHELEIFGTGSDGSFKKLNVD